jgi:hypothetical protein
VGSQPVCMAAPLLETNRSRAMQRTSVNSRPEDEGREMAYQERVRGILTA